MTAVVVTGIGALSSAGTNVQALWNTLISGGSGIRYQQIAAEGDASRHVAGSFGTIRNDDLEGLLQGFERRSLQGAERFSQFAAVATREALDDARIERDTELLRQAGIVLGCSAAGSTTIEQGYARLFLQNAATVHPLTVPRLMTSAPPSILSMLFGVRGPCFAIASACSSGAQAIAEGMYMIRSGRVSTVIVGGTDASLTFGGIKGWEGLGALSQSACRPFSSGRDGTVLGEGAAILILEAEEQARGRGARIYARVRGAGITSDAGHLTQPDWKGAAAAITAAHRDAQIPLDIPLLINAHGTGTRANDRAEAMALRHLYGALDRSLVFATKPAHGHMLGATGAIEFITALLALDHGEVPPLLGFQGPDEECDLPLALARTAVQYDTFLSTSFAFGGLNCAIIAERVGSEGTPGRSS